MIIKENGIEAECLNCGFIAVKLTADVLKKFKKAKRLLFPLHDFRITTHINKHGVIANGIHFLEDHYAVRLPFRDATICVPSIEEESGIERGLDELKRKFIKY